MEWSPDQEVHELMFYERLCSEQIMMMTDSVNNLVLDPNTMTLYQAMEHMEKHGASLYPHVLSNETAAAIQDYILECN